VAITYDEPGISYDQPGLTYDGDFVSAAAIGLFETYRRGEPPVALPALMSERPFDLFHVGELALSLQTAINSGVVTVEVDTRPDVVAEERFIASGSAAYARYRRRRRRAGGVCGRDRCRSA
jgi:hypothetical protein